MNTPVRPQTSLTAEQIREVVDGLPVQSRVMLRILLLQYLELTQEDIEYIAHDQPDPRFQSGTQPEERRVSQELIQEVVDRVAQYRTYFRQKREQTWLLMECLKKQIAVTELTRSIAERMLSKQFGVEQQGIQELTQRARTALPRPEIRRLEQGWDNSEIEEDDFKRKRLSVEFQTHARRLDRMRRRLVTAQREHQTAGGAPLQDHEVAHIWGIPASSLSARKVKALHQYLQGLQSKLEQAGEQGKDGVPIGHQVDLWKETFLVLSRQPVERSVAVFDGLERTEEALLDKLQALAAGSLREDIESNFWQEVSQSLFALQRLTAIQAEQDVTQEAIEEDLIRIISPIKKEELEEERKALPEKPEELSAEAQHVLRSLMGESR